MGQALKAYLAAVSGSADHRDGVRAGARAVADRPWDVVVHAGLLARCALAVAPEDLGLTADLRVTGPDAGRAVVRIERGQPYPELRHPGRLERGAFDTPVEMARRVVAASLAALPAPPRVGLDPACGTGAFLLAMAEAGVREIRGTDTDPVALEVARVAVPRAKLAVADALAWSPDLVDLVVGNPPFVPPERQDKALRAELRRRFPWLHGRFDLVIPFASCAVDRVHAGGVVGLVLPAAAMVQPYGAVLRRRWIERHRIVELSGPHPFSGASVDVFLLVLEKGGGPAPLPVFGVPPEELLRLDNVPFHPELRPGDIPLVQRIRAASRPLGDLCEVDTGVVAHGSGKSKEERLFEDPAPGRVPFADARLFFSGGHRWLDYDPAALHRSKRPALFEPPKIVVQRLRGYAPVRAAIDNDGIYVGHTCTVVVPRDDTIPLPRLLALVQSPLVDGITRVEGGRRLDLYPKDVRAFPVPKVWWTDPSVPLAKAWGLTPAEVARLTELAAR